MQARELNQMQSMLQAQIDSLGRSTFEDGAAVVHIRELDFFAIAAIQNDVAVLL